MSYNTKRHKELIKANERKAKAGNKLAAREVENLKKYDKNPQMIECYIGFGAMILVPILLVIIGYLICK